MLAKLWRIIRVGIFLLISIALHTCKQSEHRETPRTDVHIVQYKFARPLQLVQLQAVKDSLLNIEEVAHVGLYTDIPRFPDQVDKFSLSLQEDTVEVFAYSLQVDPGFLHCFEFPVTTGRDFTESTDSSGNVYLVSESLADQWVLKGEKPADQNHWTEARLFPSNSPDSTIHNNIIGTFRGDLGALMADPQKARNWTSVPVILTPGTHYSYLAIRLTKAAQPDIQDRIAAVLEGLSARRIQTL